MSEDPMDVVYSLVERAYVRLQTSDVLIRCLEEGSSTPIQQMVEGLILAGPQSLGFLREMVLETGSRRSQVLEDLAQVYSELEKNLKNYGLELNDSANAYAAANLSSINFLQMLRDQQVVDEETQVTCLQLLRDGRELLISLIGHIRLLEEIETYLQDWLWGLAFESARQGGKDILPPASFSL